MLLQAIHSCVMKSYITALSAHIPWNFRNVIRVSDINGLVVHRKYALKSQAGWILKPEAVSIPDVPCAVNIIKLSVAVIFPLHAEPRR